MADKIDVNPAPSLEEAAAEYVEEAGGEYVETRVSSDGQVASIGIFQREGELSRVLGATPGERSGWTIVSVNSCSSITP